jgi:alpha-amylase/alpha-mannosidase (GH57 family)
MSTNDSDLIETWRKLQTSDHFYYMCTKWSNDGDVHAYFSPYQSPYDAYIAFMNALSDLQLRVSRVVAEQKEKAITLGVIHDSVRSGGVKVIPEFEPIMHHVRSVWEILVHRFRSLFVLK